MPDISLLMLITLILSAGCLLLLLVLLLRAAPAPRADERITDLQSAQRHIGERLAATAGEVQAAIARASDETGRAMAGFTLEQTKLLSEGATEQRARLNAIEKVLLERLAQDAQTAVTRFEDHRTAQSDVAAGQSARLNAIEKALLDRLAQEAQAAAGRFEDHRAAQSEVAAGQTARLDAAEKALLERLAQDAQKATARFDDHRTIQNEAAALLRRDVGAFAAEQRTTQAEAEARLRKAIADDMLAARDLIDRKAVESRNEIETKLKEMREANDKRLADIQASVNEQLHAAVEKQMTASFERVIDQFTQVQKAMGDVAAVTGQIGDLKRLFSNVKTRGGWGETQVKAVLDDFLPAGTYETNVKLKEGSNDAVEFAILMPTPGEGRVRLPVDAKFPVEDYERLLFANDAGDVDGEAQARRGLESRIRSEAAKIAQKYIVPPATTEFAVMYLPTESLYAEVARIPGLTDDIGRQHRVFVCGPSLLPAMLRTIQLGHITLALSRNAESVRELLAATKAEMGKMDGVLERLGRNVGTISNTIVDARRRTRAIAKTLKSVEALPSEQSGALLGINDGDTEEIGLEVEE